MNSEKEDNLFMLLQLECLRAASEDHQMTLCKFATNFPWLVLEVRFELLMTPFRGFRISSFFWEFIDSQTAIGLLHTL